MHGRETTTRGGLGLGRSRGDAVSLSCIWVEQHWVNQAFLIIGMGSIQNQAMFGSSCIGCMSTGCY
eukprot:1137294-Pelagomonas_calceolata.AAC.3